MVQQVDKKANCLYKIARQPSIVPLVSAYFPPWFDSKAWHEHIDGKYSTAIRKKSTAYFLLFLTNANGLRGSFLPWNAESVRSMDTFAKAESRRILLVESIGRNNSHTKILKSS